MNEIRNTRPEASAGQEGASTSESLAALLGERAVNLRQIILRAHRGMNRRITKKFAVRGYADLRPAHLSVLANMNLGQTSFAELADRAQMPVQGVSEIAADLGQLGFLRLGKESDPGAESANFTDAGWELMLTSFNIQRELEAEFKDRLQPGDIDHLRRILSTLFDTP